jgi:dephospho-CoA kinase
VVATTRVTQETRLLQRSSYTDAEARALIEAQWPIDEKARLADVLIWNEGPIGRLDDQALLFSQLLREF